MPYMGNTYIWFHLKISSDKQKCVIDKQKNIVSKVNKQDKIWPNMATIYTGGYLEQYLHNEYCYIYMYLIVCG